MQVMVLTLAMLVPGRVDDGCGGGGASGSGDKIAEMLLLLFMVM